MKTHKNNPAGTVSVIGMGKLGACYAAFYADHGFNVIGVDNDIQKIEKIEKGEAPVSEPGLTELIRKNRSKITVTTDYQKAIQNSHATFIIVPTPSKPDGSFSVDFVISSAKEIGKALRTKKRYHLVTVVSTVLPEDSRNHIIPILEKYSKKKCGVGFGYCYSPSLIALGEVLHNLENPDFLFLGSFDKKSENTLAAIFAHIYPGREPEKMSVESVELAKISLNSYITLKITFANVLRELCEKIPDANVDHITTALGKDSRIGSAYFKSGLGYGGPCFPRDNFAFASVAKRRSMKAPIALSTHTLNESIPKKISKLIRNYAQAHKAHNIGILSLSYKTNTNISEESQALEIVRLLSKQSSITVFDPQGYDHNTHSTLTKNVHFTSSLDEIIEKSNLLFIGNKDPHYHALPTHLAKHNKKVIVVDPWGMMRREHFPPKVVYIALGRT